MNCFGLFRIGRTQLLLVATLFGGLLNGVSLHAADITVSAIVISKNCSDTSSPETLLQSLENPECPHPGNTQLIQVTIANFSKNQQKVGVEIVLKKNGEVVENAFPKEARTIAPLDETRVLHSYTIPEDGGKYLVSAVVWDSSYKKVLSRADSGVERFFFVPGTVEIKRIKEEMEKSQQKIEAINNPKKLEFDLPDLRWETVYVVPKHVLRGEKFKVRLDLVNVGGDIVRNVETQVEYYNVRLPLRKTAIAVPKAEIMAPGETITFELEYTLPDDQLLGEYQLVALVDPNNKINEAKEDNNQAISDMIRLSDIKQLLPPDKFTFEEKGLFLFQWDSLVFSEFKLQVGIDEKFEDPGTFFDLPQGDRWIADKEMVPLSGELPQMALGLSKTFNKSTLYWRVIGRKTDGRQSFSDVRSFTISSSTAATDTGR
ncbi:MAG: hypothetical protein HQM12_20800 [SAR324 cluster bacterium]|nr:hypothetical protein [SAR324 cluster bacterium]